MASPALAIREPRVAPIVPRSRVLRDHMPELDVLRGVAIFSVFLYHAFFWSGATSRPDLIERVLGQVTHAGWLGVDLFFVLSGFLITGGLIDHRSLHGFAYYKWFYRRRAFRILPLYYVTLAIVGAALLVTGETSGRFLALSAIYLPNIALLAGAWSTYPLVVLWSIGIEEQAYLVWPFVVHRLALRTLVWIFAVICVVEPMLRGVTFWSGALRESASMATWLRLDGFAWGALLALIVRDPRCTPRWLIRAGAILMIGALILAAVSAPVGGLTRTTALGAALQPALASALFGAAVALALALGSVRPNLMSVPVLAYFGRLSYCLYLVHQFLFWGYDRLPSAAGTLPPAVPSLVVRGAIVLAASVAVAELSWRYFEGPLLALKERAG